MRCGYGNRAATSVSVLRRRWDEGKASGRQGPLDIKGLIAGERAKLKDRKGRRG